jgi:hypothetical protein
MPLTAAQRTAFFEEDAQMGIPNRTVVQLQTEGLSGVEDLEQTLTKEQSKALLLTYDALREG